MEGEDLKNEQKRQFNIGKALGLEGKDEVFQKLQASLDLLSAKFKEKRRADINDLKKECEEARQLVVKAKKEITDNIDAIVEKTIELISNLQPLNQPHLQQNPVLLKRAEELYQIKLDRFKTYCNTALQIEGEAANKLKRFEELLTNCADKLENDYQDYLRNMEANRIDFTEMGKGYQYGVAVKIAYSSDSSK